MNVPVQITVHNLELTEAIRTEIEKKADKLGQFYEEMQKLRTVVGEKGPQTSTLWVTG